MIKSGYAPKNESINESFIRISTHASGESKYKVEKQDPRYVYFHDTLDNELRYDKKEQRVERKENGKWDFYILDDEISNVDIK